MIRVHLNLVARPGRRDEAHLYRLADVIGWRRRSR